jgi:hypothetical protein
MWGQSQDDYNTVQNADSPNEGSFGHEVVAGAASFGAFKLFEDHQRKEGKTVNHAFAKELLAGFVGGEVDKLIEVSFICTMHGAAEVQQNPIADM